MGILSTIIDMNAAINENFRNSKLPMFIKKRVAMKKRLKVSNWIDNNFGDLDRLHASIIQEYFEIILRRGFYDSKNVRIVKLLEVDSNGPTIIAVIEKEVDPNFVVTFIFREEGYMDVSYMTRLKDTSIPSESLVWKTNHVDHIAKSEFVDDTKYSNVENITIGIVNELVDVLTKQIRGFIRDEIDRSERIYNNEI